MAALPLGARAPCFARTLLLLLRLRLRPCDRSIEGEEGGGREGGGSAPRLFTDLSCWWGCGGVSEAANDSGQFAEAASYFQQSRVLALDTSNSKSAAMAKCKIGMAKGNAQFEDYIANVVAEMDAQDQDDGD